MPVVFPLARRDYNTMQKQEIQQVLVVRVLAQGIGIGSGLLDAFEHS